MGLTQHRFGVDNVKAMVNLALARGMIGRRKSGILPIRGHSGVQGTSEVRADPTSTAPASSSRGEGGAEARGDWDCEVPTTRVCSAAHVSRPPGRGASTFITASAATTFETCRTRTTHAGALGRPRVPVHQDIVLNAPHSCHPVRLCSSSRSRRVTRRRAAYLDVDGAAGSAISPEVAGADGVNIGEARGRMGDPSRSDDALPERPAPLRVRGARGRPQGDGAARFPCTRASRGCKARGAVGAVGRRASRDERLSQHARQPRALLGGPDPDAGLARGQAHAGDAAGQAVQLDDLRAEGSDHRVAPPRRRALPRRISPSAGSPKAIASSSAPRSARWRRRRASAPAAAATCRRSGPKPTCSWRASTIRSRASRTTTPSSPSRSWLLQVLELQLLRLDRPLDARTLQQRLRRSTHLRANLEPKIQAQPVKTSV